MHGAAVRTSRIIVTRIIVTRQASAAHARSRRVDRSGCMVVILVVAAAVAAAVAVACAARPLCAVRAAGWWLGTMRGGRLDI